MKNTVIWSILSIALCFFICSILMFLYCRNIEKRLDETIAKDINADDKNIISIIDTIYGRKYVIDVDTITGAIYIVGPRHTPVMIEDSAH